MSQTLRAMYPTRHATRAGLVEVVTAHPSQFVDITDRLIEAIGRMGLVDGLLSVQSLHTTAGLLVNESEELLMDDLDTLFECLAPRFDAYAHDDLNRRPAPLPDERRNGHAHCRAALLQTSITLQVLDRTLVLGRWQRVLFAEFDGPQRRSLSLVGSGAIDEAAPARRVR